MAQQHYAREAPAQTIRCITCVIAKRKQSKLQHFFIQLQNQHPSPRNICKFMSPVADDKVNRTPLVTVGLKHRALNNVGVKPHAPNGGEFLLIRCEDEMRQ